MGTRIAIDRDSHAVRTAASCSIFGGSRLRREALGMIGAVDWAGVAAIVVKMIISWDGAPDI